jgi:3-hydroxybutyryl-CoA dehydratase
MTYEDFHIGYKGQYSKTVTEADNIAFAQLSGDYNPIHFDDAAARQGGFPARISNGFVTESRVAAALVETFGSNQTLVLAIEKNTRFLKPVYMNDEITATVEVIGRVPSMRILRIQAACVNQRQEQVAATRMVIRVVPLASAEGGGR